MDLCHFSADKPVILVIGGSLGSVAVNNAVRLALPELLEHFQIVHLCGKGKVDDSLTSMKGYTQFEYIKDELCDLKSRCKRNLRTSCSEKTESADPALSQRKPRRSDFKCPLL